MKPLTKKDIPALASLIREATHRRVQICESFLNIMRGDKVVAVVTIRRSGRALATHIISAFVMRSILPVRGQPEWRWQIVI